MTTLNLCHSCRTMKNTAKFRSVDLCRKCTIEAMEEFSEPIGGSKTMINPHQALIEEKVAELIEKVKSINSECAFEAEEKFAYQQGFQDAIAMFYIDLTGTPKTKGTIQATIDTVLEKQRRELLPFMQHEFQCATEFEAGGCDCGLKEALTPTN